MDPPAFGAILEGFCSAALGRALSGPELGRLSKYLEMLLKWHKSQRLVAHGDPAWIAETLIADSLLFLRVLTGPVHKLADIGSGAGFPGIPIKIVSPEMSVTLIESRRRRASFLRAVVRELDLVEARVLDQRLESVQPTLGAAFDAAVMRCAGDPALLLPLALPLLRRGGMVVASGPPAAGRASRRGRQDRTNRFMDEHRYVPELESTVVSGVDGRPRQFLVARKD